MEGGDQRHVIGVLYYPIGLAVSSLESFGVFLGDEGVLRDV